MKSVGEVMAIGRTFQESLQKALRGLETGVDGFNLKTVDPEKIGDELAYPRAERLWYVADAFGVGMPLDEVYRYTKIDPWFLAQIKEIVDTELALEKRKLADLDKDELRGLKRMGFADRRIAYLLKVREGDVRSRRHELGIRPVFKRVDTCAAEFATQTAYLYSTYDEECEAAPTGRKKVIVLGGGPNRIGQGIEFDYCCVHAAMALSDDGYETIMVNCNPETVSTDYDTSDRLYFEPLTLEDVLEIVHVEKPFGVIVQYGGQTPLKLARDLEANGVPIIGTSPDMIDMAEDRERFQQMLHRLELRQPSNRTARTEKDAMSAADAIGYPLVVRPSYVLGGRAMEIVHEPQDLERYMREAVKVSNDSPVLLDRFLNDAIEVDVDAVCDGTQVVIGGIMEHIEQAGVHSGDSACSLPPFSLSAETQDELRRQTVAMAHGLSVVGLMNVQFAIQNGTVYVLEVNPRASRTVPYVSKATGRPLAKIAARCMVGQSLAAQGIAGEIVPPYFSVKEAVFPFIKFPGVDTILGPEMKSTGEVMGVGRDVRRGVPQVAGRRRREASRAGQGVRERQGRRQAARDRAREDPRRTGFLDRRHARHGRRARGGRRAGDAGQQGARRPSAHRRHDEERRDRARRQHGAGKARGDSRQLSDSPRGAHRSDPDVHDARRRPRRGDRPDRDARARSLLDPVAARAPAPQRPVGPVADRVGGRDCMSVAGPSQDANRSVPEGRRAAPRVHP